jgi:hypothetical protein
MMSCICPAASSVVDGLGRPSYAEVVVSSPSAVGGWLCCARRAFKSALTHPAASGPSCGELRDPAVLVEGLGCLSLPLEDIPQAEKTKTCLFDPS